jgi:hypothetical protein
LPVTRRGKARSIVAIAVAMLALLAGGGGASAGSDTMRIEPPSQTVAEGSTFTVRVVHNASVETSGAQASVTFDPAKAQIVAVERGPSHADAAIFAPPDLAAAIAAANQAGKLAMIATAFIPPASVPAGDADFLVITFTAVGCGRFDLGLPAGPADAVLLDGRPETYGGAWWVTTTGGTVDILCDDATATPADGGTPWLMLGLAAGVVVIAAAGGLLLLRRSGGR